MHTKLSREAIDLLNQLLLKDPKKRISVSQACKHDWFVKRLGLSVSTIDEMISPKLEAHHSPTIVISDAIATKPLT